MGSPLTCVKWEAEREQVRKGNLALALNPALHPLKWLEIFWTMGLALARKAKAVLNLVQTFHVSTFPSQKRIPAIT